MACPDGRLTGPFRGWERFMPIRRLEANTASRRPNGSIQPPLRDTGAVIDYRFGEAYIAAGELEDAA